jgi:hypothetical protein
MIKENTPEMQNSKNESLQMPEYKVIDKISINKNVLKHLIKCSELSNVKHIEGYLFGHEEEQDVRVENSFVANQNGTDEISYLV